MKTKLTLTAAVALLATMALAASAPASVRYDGGIGVKAASTGAQQQAPPHGVSTSLASVSDPTDQASPVQLRRDGSQAVPVTFPASQADRATDGSLSWGDVAGAAGVIAAMGLILVAGIRFSNRDARRPAHA
jgi:type 1 fimbria pilin